MYSVFYFTSNKGMKTALQRFLSPTSKKRKQKSCVLFKRAIFKQSTLDNLDTGKRISIMKLQS